MKIDGVFSGGGIKGAALAGAYEALEARGFQFVRLAGTSAEQSLLHSSQRVLRVRRFGSC